jgi:hypothetical protein
VDRPLAIPDELRGQRAEPPEAAVHAPGDVGPLLREHQRPGEGARVGQLGGDDIAAPRLAVPDRDLPPRLAEVELAQLARAIARALVGARKQEAGAQLAQEVVEDRLAAVVAELLDLLADPHP